MIRYGIEINPKHIPPLDPGFFPIGLYRKAFETSAAGKEPLGLALERARGQMAVVKTFVHGTKERFEADCYYTDRLLKTMLWLQGGFRVYVSGSRPMYEYLARTYSDRGERGFDFHFMSHVFEHPFEVVWTDELPRKKNAPQKLGGHMSGCRIGFDAGGSDRKVSALIDGESVYDEEVVWLPKTNPDPRYHYDGIVSALKTAATKLPRVDAVGISSAGIFINNRTMRASLFAAVPEELQLGEQVKDIYIRAVKDTFGDIPFAVVNDGDVSTLAGKMSLGKNNVLGIAMGTSEAAGFVDKDGCITGWLNELAFVPVDCAQDAMRDEWSGDKGVGSKYFSQDAVIKLSPAAGIAQDESLTPAEKLKVVQAKMDEKDVSAAKIYESIGVYLGHSLAYYHSLYNTENDGDFHVLLLGRVMSGKGGDLVLETCKKVLADEYPEAAKLICAALPDEKFRRVGQSATAATLPAITKGAAS